jgi:hypothetical protein
VQFPKVLWPNTQTLEPLDEVLVELDDVLVELDDVLVELDDVLVEEDDVVVLPPVPNDRELELHAVSAVTAMARHSNKQARLIRRISRTSFGKVRTAQVSRTHQVLAHVKPSKFPWTQASEAPGIGHRARLPATTPRAFRHGTAAQHLGSKGDHKRAKGR